MGVPRARSATFQFPATNTSYNSRDRLVYGDSFKQTIDDFAASTDRPTMLPNRVNPRASSAAIVIAEFR